MTGVPPPDLLRLARRREETLGLRRENSSIPAAVNHEQRSASERPYAAKRIRHRSNQLREGKIGEVAARRQHESSRSAIALGDRECEIGPERIPDDAKSVAVDFSAGGESAESEACLLDRRAPSRRQLERISHGPQLERIGALAVERQVDGERRDAQGNEHVTNRLRHVFLSRGVAVEEQRRWNGFARARQAQYGRDWRRGAHTVVRAERQRDAAATVDRSFLDDALRYPLPAGHA